jgi:hypothetical protein
MPIDPRRRDAIAEAVAAYNGANPLAPSPRNAARLLVVMFPASDVCQRSMANIATLGFSARTVPTTLRRLTDADAGFLTRQRGTAYAPNTYHLHLPPRAQP